MKREFRAFSAESGFFVEKWVMHPDGSCEIPEGGWDLMGYKEDPSTFIVQQFTGLVDDNGVKVFEGDLLNVYFGDNHNPEGKHKSVEVYFDEDVFQYCVRGGNLKQSSFKQSLVGYASPKYEVVGMVNIKK